MKKLLIVAVMAICSYSFSQVTVTGNGNVGVGVDAPTQKLHVAGNSYFMGISALAF
ncbi:MAG: hypothetical protein LBV02_07715 [Bacteroidales bacterium]|jgi:hypothetical protein|nr:hypothetical protein [Bacteroidales bacterium]